MKTWLWLRGQTGSCPGPTCDVGKILETVLLARVPGLFCPLQARRAPGRTLELRPARGRQRLEAAATVSVQRQQKAGLVTRCTHTLHPQASSETAPAHRVKKAAQPPVLLFSSFLLLKAPLSLSSRLVCTPPKRPDHLQVPREHHRSLFASGTCNN